MKEPVTDERCKEKEKEKAFSWISKLAGKNNKKSKDDISPALRAHHEAEKKANEEKEHDADARALGVPQRSRSVSVVQAEKKDQRRKSLTDAVLPARTEPEKTVVKFTKAEEDKPKSKKDSEKVSKPHNDAERALAKAKKAEAQAVAARSEATRLIAESNKAFAAAAKAAADAQCASSPKPEPELSNDHSRISTTSTSVSERGADLELSQSHNSAREDSDKKGIDDHTMSSMSSTSTLNFSQVLDDSKEHKSESPRESASRGGFFSSKKGHQTHLTIEPEEQRLSITRAERETKVRTEYALVAEKAAKKAIKHATKAKLEADVAATKAAELESRQLAKEAKRRARSPRTDPKHHDLEVLGEPEATRKSTSVNELERMPSSSSLFPTLTLNEVLGSDEGVAAFKEFAAEGFVLENISFVLEVRAFDALDEALVGTEPWLVRAHLIFDTYVQVGSPQEVNMTSKIRKDVVEKFGANTIEPGIFKGLAAEALRIVRSNDWPRFIKSEQYKKLEAAAGLSAI
jgi:hypothetical protein